MTSSAAGSMPCTALRWPSSGVSRRRRRDAGDVRLGLAPPRRPARPRPLRRLARPDQPERLPRPAPPARPQRAFARSACWTRRRAPSRLRPTGRLDDRTADADAFDRAFARLSVDDRAILVLHHLQERPRGRDRGRARGARGNDQVPTPPRPGGARVGAGEGVAMNGPASALRSIRRSAISWPDVRPGGCPTGCSTRSPPRSMRAGGGRPRLEWPRRRVDAPRGLAAAGTAVALVAVLIVAVGPPRAALRARGVAGRLPGRIGRSPRSNWPRSWPAPRCPRTRPSSRR